MSHFFRRQLDEALSWIRKAAQENPKHSTTFLVLASTLGHMDQLDEARAAMREFLVLRPVSSATWERRRRRFLEEDLEYLLSGALRAGLPE